MKTALDQGIRNVEGVTYTGDAKNHDKQFASLAFCMLFHLVPQSQLQKLISNLHWMKKAQ